MRSYLEKLRDPRWQRRRLEVFERAHFQCEACHDLRTWWDKLYGRMLVPTRVVRNALALLGRRAVEADPNVDPAGFGVFVLACSHWGRSD